MVLWNLLPKRAVLCPLKLPLFILFIYLFDFYPAPLDHVYSGRLVVGILQSLETMVTCSE